MGLRHGAPLDPEFTSLKTWTSGVVEKFSAMYHEVKPNMREMTASHSSPEPFRTSTPLHNLHNPKSKDVVIGKSRTSPARRTQEATILPSDTPVPSPAASNRPPQAPPAVGLLTILKLSSRVQRGTCIFLAAPRPA